MAKRMGAWLLKAKKDVAVVDLREISQESHAFQTTGHFLFLDDFWKSSAKEVEINEL